MPFDYILRIFKHVTISKRSLTFEDRVLTIIDEQIQRENDHPNDDYKACIWGLYRLRGLAEEFDYEGESSEAVRMKLLSAMRQLQENHQSEFMDEYHSARASMGSVLNTIAAFELS